MARYCATILLGAFLLFQIQPQIARTILPWFGGGAAVWSTCMLFFQVLLLGGYAYAHFLHRRLRPGQQALLHMSLLAVSLYFLPVTPSADWQPNGTENPSLHILLLLTATVGMPYLLLSATGPLMQSWFAREFEGRSPYRLYALSNVGSLAALLSFPFLFEPNLTIGIQAQAWSAGYLAFIALCSLCAFGTARTYAARLHAEFEASMVSGAHFPAVGFSPQATGNPAPAGAASAPPAPAGGVAVATRPAVAAPPHTTPAALDTATTPAGPPASAAAPGIGQQARWVALAALPSVMLLAVTNTICQDLAVIPFFWVMPLALYLVTFILTFESERWYRRGLLAPLLGAVALAIFMIPPVTFMNAVVPQIVLLCAGLFLCGMVCHGELVHDKPPAEHLTGFYLFVALGGALGGVFVAVLAPVLFDTYLETELALGACLVAAGYAGYQVRAQGARRAWFRVVMPGATAVLLAVGVVLRIQDGASFEERSRNFFGTLTVKNERRLIPAAAAGFVTQSTTILTHGSTIHGRQAVGAGLVPGQGMTYYWPGSGVAHALRCHPARADRPLRVGVIGLGTGTLAHYAQADDRHTYYELDPDVHRVAEQYFTYLMDARGRGAHVDVHIGDARIQLERAARQHGSMQFDVLVVDAFNSDAIPVHLLTKECNAIYWKHLAAGGILALHVSNRHLDLIPVVRGLAEDAGKEMRVIHAQPKDVPDANTSDWILVTGNADYLARPELAATRTTAPAQSLLWTDDFSSLWHVLK